jgi:hypothetical protein
MLLRMRLLLTLVLLFACMAGADKKKKSTLPDYVVEAHTCFVLVDPDAGTPLNDPNANKTAQRDVEIALLNWGRLRPVESMSMADLVITVRTGNGKIVRPTVDGEPTNDRPVIVEPNNNGIHIAGQGGRNPDAAQSGPQGVPPHLGSEVGPAEDTFVVYRGGPVGDALERAPLWRYSAKNALHSPDVPAVGEFQKAVDEAVQLKEQQKQQQQQQRQKQQPPPQPPTKP